MLEFNLKKEEKIKIMNLINWDYLDNPEDMLKVIEGNLEKSGSFNKDKLFIRSIESLTWYHLVALWGIENIKKMYTPEISRRVWNKDRRKQYDFIIALLRNETLPAPRWGVKHNCSKRNRFFSHGRYSTQQSIL